jgi:hypothetical protein
VYHLGRAFCYVKGFWCAICAEHFVVLRLVWYSICAELFVMYRAYGIPYHLHRFQGQMVHQATCKKPATWRARCPISPCGLHRKVSQALLNTYGMTVWPYSLGRASDSLCTLFYHAACTERAIIRNAICRKLSSVLLCSGTRRSKCMPL